MSSDIKKMKPLTRTITQTVCHNCGKLVFVSTRSDMPGGFFYMDDFSFTQKFIDGKTKIIEKNWGHKCEK